MLTKDILTEVEDVVQDASFTRATLLGYLNQSLLEVAAEVRLPDLMDSDTVDTATDAAKKPMPTNYHRDPFHIYSVTQERTIAKGRRIKDFNRFLARNPGLDKSGQVFDAAVKGSSLYYQGIPASSETLRVHYYRKPATLVDDDTSEPEGVPVHLHQAVLVPLTAAKVFNKIEDGVEEQRHAFDSQMAQYGVGLQAMKDYLGPEEEEPDYIYEDQESIFDEFY